MDKKKVVVKYKNGNQIKGYTNGFFPNKASFHIDTLNGEVKEIRLEDLKAVFFVWDFEGNKNHKKTYRNNVSGGGQKIKVTFRDGEEVVGYTSGYSPERQGFVMTTADLGGNNHRIYVVKSAARKIDFV
jgi:hypothetical protein